MKNNSNSVWSSQAGPHKNLINVLKRYDDHIYKRPIADFSKRSFEEILTSIQEFGNNSIVLDICCGTGESSFNLALLYPDHLVVGIDKSINRLSKQNNFKENLPKNVLLIRGEVFDLYYLFYLAVSNKILSIHKHFIFYPNPWPKEKHYKRRFSANPITPFLFKLNSQIEVRSNWKIYLEEFCIAADYYGHQNYSLDAFTPEKTITAFERKFTDSGHLLFRCVVQCD